MERFQNKIKQWVELDNKVKILNDQVREIRNERNNVSDEIVAFLLDTSKHLGETADCVDPHIQVQGRQNKIAIIRFNDRHA